MSNNIVNQQPYLKTSREFPTDIDNLVFELNKSYIDIANAVNNRTISIFPKNKVAITGEKYFLNNNGQQTLRQVYTFTSTAPIIHSLQLPEIDYFTSPFGSFTNGTNWYGLIYGSNVAIAGQISFYITPTQIVFLVGAGAPVLTKGIIVLEWMSFV